MLRIAAQGRDVLRGIVAHLDRSLCDGSSCRALRLALGRHGEVGGEADGVVEIVLFLRALLLVVTVVEGSCFTSSDYLCETGELS